MAVAVDNLFPDYIPRDEEEREIVAAVGRVRGSGNSEAVLLYGPGGVGKTWLERELPARQATADAVTWLHPIDLDDHAYWQLPALQDNVAGQLDPEMSTSAGTPSTRARCPPPPSSSRPKSRPAASPMPGGFSLSATRTTSPRPARPW